MLQREGTGTEGVQERLLEEEKPALEIKVSNRRVYRNIQNVHNPLAFPNI